MARSEPLSAYEATSATPTPPQPLPHLWRGATPKASRYCKGRCSTLPALVSDCDSPSTAFTLQRGRDTSVALIHRQCRRTRQVHSRLPHLTLTSRGRPGTLLATYVIQDHPAQQAHSFLRPCQHTCIQPRVSSTTYSLRTTFMIRRKEAPERCGHDAKQDLVVFAEDVR